MRHQLWMIWTSVWAAAWVCGSPTPAMPATKKAPSVNQAARKPVRTKPSILPLGEIWETYHIGGKKAGFIRRKITLRPGARQAEMITTFAFKTGEQLQHVRHTFRFEDTPGYPWISYRIWTPEEEFEVKREGNTLSQRVLGRAGAPSRREAPPGAVPTFGTYLHLLRFPFEEGKALPIVVIDDYSLDTLLEHRWVGQGWEKVTLNGKTEKLWRIEEFQGGQGGQGGQGVNLYWLDEKRRLRKGDWLGSESLWVPDKKAALAGLSPDLVKLAE